MRPLVLPCATVLVLGAVMPTAAQTTDTERAAAGEMQGPPIGGGQAGR